MEKGIYDILELRKVAHEQIQGLKDDKIDMNVISVMTDEELGGYFPKNPHIKKSGKGCDQCVSDRSSAFGNKYASKDNRRLEMGWLHFQEGQYRQTRHHTTRNHTVSDI
ncbi:hypothetical protein AOLI_G00082650 [Acnodon oligacanthus]